MIASVSELAVMPKDEMDLIKRTVAVGATDTELALFLYDCNRRGIHPLDRLLHFTKRGGKYTPVTSIDFMRSQAAASGEMAGSDDPHFIDMDPDSHPIEATVTVYRMTQGQRFAYTATARWAEYCPDNAPMWKRMPHTMLGKCAEALALRKAFPQQLAGLYSREEMDQAGEPQGYTVEAPNHQTIKAANSTSAPSEVSGGLTTVGHERGDSGASHSDDGPDLGVELPAGARLILTVKSGGFGAKAFVLLNAPVDGTDPEYPVYNDALAAFAEQACQDRIAVFVECKQAITSKKWRIEKLTAVPKDYGLPLPAANTVLESEIPF